MRPIASRGISACVNGGNFGGPAQVERLERRQLMSSSALAATVDPAPKPVGVTIHAEAQDPFSGVVGKVTGADTANGWAKHLSSDQAVVDWGDHTITTGELSLSSVGDVLVSGNHTYAKKGVYAVNVIVETHPPIGFFPLLLANIKSKAEISADSHGGLTLTEVATQKFTAKLGSFEFRNVDLALTATIHWGDGTTSTGRIGRDSFDDYSVVGTHTYKVTGRYKVHVDITGRPVGAPGEPLPQFIVDLASFDSIIKVMGKA